jgi:hypothetical protein
MRRLLADVREGMSVSFVDDIAQALAPSALPDVVRERLLHEGYLTIDAAGLFAADCYAVASQIHEVEDDRVRLNVAARELVRR